MANRVPTRIGGSDRGSDPGSGSAGPSSAVIERKPDGKSFGNGLEIMPKIEKSSGNRLLNSRSVP